MLASVRFPFLALVMCFAVLGNAANAQNEKLNELLQRSPAPANSIGYLHLPSLKKLMADANMSHNMTDNVEDVWLVSDLEPTSLVPRWEAGYATMQKDITAADLAAALKGYVDNIGGKDVVWTPKQTYLVPIGQQRMGFLRPANRSLAADWLKSDSKSSVPAYLASQAKQPEKFLALLLAIDLKDAFSPVPLASRIAQFETLKDQDSSAVATVLASVQGVSIIVGRRSLQECILSIDFSQSPAALKPVATALLDEILNRNGTAAPEVKDWAVKVDGNRLSFQGAISEDSLQGVLEIFSVRQQAEEVADTLRHKETEPQNGDDPASYESKKYFDSVTANIERVRKYEAQTTGYRAKWNDQVARRIDQLGTLNVDPQLVDYGANVDGLLRNNALTIRGGNIAAGSVKAQEGLSSGYSYGYSYGGYGGGYGGYGYYDPNTSSDYQRVTDVKARGAANADYRSTLSRIDMMTSDVRRAMTDKFKVQF